jgi:phospholipid/cholesterol/gamma-HCH transport system substrate-binding protein
MLRSKAIKEGTLGLFILLGLFVFSGVIFWLRGARFKENTYQVTVQFDNAGGVREGAKVGYRGVEVGKIIGINPTSNGINVVLEIDSSLKIPKQVGIRAIRSGLLGEANVEITPKIDLKPEAENINPLHSDCQNSSLILCNQEIIKGETSVDLIETMTTLSEIYSDPVFFNNMNEAFKGITIASQKAAKLSDDLSGFTKEIRKDISKFSDTAEALTNTANVTSEQVAKLSNDLSATSAQINLLVTNLNTVIDNNKFTLSQTIANVNDSTEQLNQIIKNMNSTVTNINNTVTNVNTTVTKVNSTLETTDTQKIAKNLESFSEDLKEISTKLNQDTNLVTLQQTLDSARVTFENTAKITSDLDELTGDPEFRQNVRKLVNGLSSLVSYTDTLEQQIELAQTLKSADQIAQNSLKNQVSTTREEGRGKSECK